VTPQELAELDLAVAKAEGLRAYIDDEYGCRTAWNAKDGGPFPFKPSTNPAEAMRLLVKYNLDLLCGGHPGWYAEGPDGVADSDTTGPTPEIAICRAVAALASRDKGGKT